MKELLDNPISGKELVHKLTTNDFTVETIEKNGEIIEVYSVILKNGDKVKIKELVYSNK